VAASITETTGVSRDGLALPQAAPDDADVERRTLTVPVELAGYRLDQALARLLPEFSRSRIQAWINQGLITLDGWACRPRDKLIGGERVDVLVLLEDQVECGPEPVPLSIVFEDEDLLVVDKPAGLVVHPAAGNWHGTLQNGLLYHDARMARLPRSGIVHRLDKDTSGLLVVAKTSQAHRSLVAQLQARTVKRQYLAVVAGLPETGGTVDAPIGRHPTQRVRMAVTPTGKPAVTHFIVRERYRTHSLLEVRLETGRTHQIRVHLAYLRYPLLGDPVYGGRPARAAGVSGVLLDCLRQFRRQALHAERLALRHPVSGADLEWHAPVPQDMRELIGALREDAA
jgi:23S rRNA pseudouridine1911/1915/1917 synthase